MGKTSIEWTDASWNPVVGCTEVSPGCANCYAARLAATRLKHVAEYVDLAEIKNGTARWKGEVGFCPDRLEEPLHWRKPRRIFVCDMGDLFHEEVHLKILDRVFMIAALSPEHTFQILTKRAKRMQDYFATDPAKRILELQMGIENGSIAISESVRQKRFVNPEWPLPNVWLGVSVENQHFADERIPALLSTPAAVRFISAEPLLGPLDLHSIPDGSTGYYDLAYPGGSGRFDHQGSRISDARLDWVICGGESGPGARPIHPDWARSLRDQCQAAGVAFFFKQWGEWAPAGRVETLKTAQRGERSRLGVFQPDGVFDEGSLGAYNGSTNATGWHTMNRIGKKAAGRLLDGREWNEFPSSSNP